MDLPDPLLVQVGEDALGVAVAHLAAPGTRDGAGAVQPAVIALQPVHHGGEQQQVGEYGGHGFTATALKKV
ncbi:hypothetical protein ACQP1W_23770 [Spirillospora sp. CA-255316]